MPRLRKTEAQRRAERFDEHYRTGKARLKLHDADIASALGLCETTLRKYRRIPDKFPLGALIRLGGILGWSDAEYMDIIGARVLVNGRGMV